MSGIVTDTGIILLPDASRVMMRHFTPGRDDLLAGESRAGGVIDRLLALTDAEVDAAADEVEATMAQRHGDPTMALEDLLAQVLGRIDPAVDLSPRRRFLLGACFATEFAVEGVSLCNPSMVPHPDQGPERVGAEGAVRFVMSVRGIGEGHRSSIGFRTGTVDPRGGVSVDPAESPVVGARPGPGFHRRDAARAFAAVHDAGSDNVEALLGRVGEEFDDTELDAAIEALLSERATRTGVDHSAAVFRGFASAAYSAYFEPDTPLSSCVLLPHAPCESRGMEDARFVQFTDDDGAVSYLATYTGWDGSGVSQQVLSTDDFVSFRMWPLLGSAATGKGLAIFPRRIGGRWVAMSRSDRETNAISYSDDLHCWNDRIVVQVPARSWELLQIGNCGSPLETEEGWLVLTHGVGPLRTYHLGALLLDLDDPTVVIGSTARPLVSPVPPFQNGYVPNVVYSCGAMRAGEHLIIPFGIADGSTGIVTLELAALLDELVGPTRALR